ncbi:MAG: ATP-binding cassette domain-containing protein [Thermoanaerobaculia bacterium]
MHSRDVSFDGPLVELRGVHKEFGMTAALRGVHLRVPFGETVALIGPSGCGKSTILRLVLGLVFPSEGDVLFRGARVNPRDAIPVRRRIGYVVQDGGLFPHLTARDNVLLLGRELGRLDSDLLARLGELAALTRFPPEALSRYPAELSGGQRQRVGLMRALLLDPELLLLDEPLAALDPMVRSKLQEDLREIFRSLSRTVVLVTHDLAEAAFLADRIVLLDHGTVVQEGALDDLRNRPVSPFVSEFVRSQRGLAW